ncbi:MAG: tetratricopeptide repeat protein, partial [Gammaproteobacteria bacterium]
MSIIIRSVVLMLFLGIFLAVGTSHASFDEGVAAANEGQYGTAFQEFSVLAEQGDSRAQQALAWMYYEGQGRKKDFEKAAYWYGKAAEQGNVTAQINLAQMYAYGKGVTQDFSIAAKWWTVLAEQGDRKAQSALAGLYYHGNGKEHNLSKAFELWQ